MRRSTALVVLSVLAGAFLGVVAPRSEASSLISFEFAPPIESSGSTVSLTNGWHSYGEDPADAGLDWGNVNSFDAFLRGWGYGPTPERTNYSYATNSKTTWLNCQNSTRVDIHSASGLYVGTSWLVHTSSSSSTVSLGHTDSGYYNNVKVGTIINFNDTCSWTGPHIHETHGYTSKTGQSANGSWQLNSSQFPAVDPCPNKGDVCPTFVNNLRANWTRKATWSY